MGMHGLTYSFDHHRGINWFNVQKKIFVLLTADDMLYGGTSTKYEFPDLCSIWKFYLYWLIHCCVLSSFIQWFLSHLSDLPVTECTLQQQQRFHNTCQQVIMIAATEKHDPRDKLMIPTTVCCVPGNFMWKWDWHNGVDITFVAQQALFLTLFF